MHFLIFITVLMVLLANEAQSAILANDITRNEIIPDNEVSSYKNCENWHPQHVIGANGQAKCEPEAMLRGAAKIFGKLYLDAGSNFNAGRVEEGAVVMIGQQSRVSPGCTFDGRVTIGLRNQLNERSLFRGATTANNVTVENDATILGNLGHFARIGEFSMVLNEAHAEPGSEIGDFSILGEESTLTENTKIGNNSCVGARLVVTSNVGDSLIMNKWGELLEVPRNQYVKYVDGRCVVTDEKPRSPTTEDQ